jgi:hypothetical protein
VIPENPSTRADIMAALADVEAEVAAFFGSLSDDELVLRVGDAWTSAQHLQHLNTSVSAVARGFGVAPLLLRLRFGRARQPSRPYAELLESYRDVLARGVQARGGFVPPREEIAPEHVAEHRAAILGRWARVNARLRAAAERWDEGRLDTLRLPHPVLGKLTMREMLFFTLYHNQHHIAAAQRRLPRFSAPSG